MVAKTDLQKLTELRDNLDSIILRHKHEQIHQDISNERIIAKYKEWRDALNAVLEELEA